MEQEVTKEMKELMPFSGRARISAAVITAVMVLALITAIWGTSAVAAGDADMTVTGIEWQEFTEEQQEIYLRGFIESFNEMRIKMMLDTLGEADREEVENNLREGGELIPIEQKDFDGLIADVDDYFAENDSDRQVSDVLVHELEILE